MQHIEGEKWKEEEPNKKINVIITETHNSSHRLAHEDNQGMHGIWREELNKKHILLNMSFFKKSKISECYFLFYKGACGI